MTAPRCVAFLGPSGSTTSALVDDLAGLEGQRLPAPVPTDPRIVEFGYLGERWTAIDCPSAPDFAQMSLDALLVADLAVIAVSSDPDAAVLAAPLLRMVEASGVPGVLFIDCATASAEVRMRDTVAALQAYARHPIVLRQVPVRRDGAIIGAVDLVSERAWKYRSDGPSDLVEIPEDLLDREREARSALLESMSDHDDGLLESLIEDRVPATGALYNICARELRENALIPAFLGSAERSNGVVRLMKAMRHEVPAPAVCAARLGGVRAASFRVGYRRHVGRTVWLRAFEEIAPGDRLEDAVVGPLSGLDEVRRDRLHPGEVAMAIKSDGLPGAAVFGAPVPRWHRALPGVLSQILLPSSERDDVKLSEALGRVVEEDPSLTTRHDPSSGAPVLTGQGDGHLRRARERMQSLFGIAAEARPLPPALRETVTGRAEITHRHKKQTGGAGQFAEVSLTLAAAERGAGFSFETRVHGGSVPRQYIAAVEAGCRDALARGPLGFPVVDVAVTLTDGRAHAVDSSDMAFRIAARSAVVQALGDAGPVLLEPIYAVSFMIPSTFAGALNPLISTRRGQLLGFDVDPDAPGWDRLSARLPEGALGDLIADLRSATQGVGRFEARFDHYQELYGRDAETMVARRAEILERA